MGDSSEKVKVVYIEDNPTNLTLVVRVLESTGKFQVFGASDGEVGLELVDEVVPALVLVDLDIPGENGFEVTRRIKASSNPAIARIPVAIVSANVLKDERTAAADAGCAEFIEKPFDLKSLRNTVARLVLKD